MLSSQGRQLCSMMGVGHFLDHSCRFTRHLDAVPHVIHVNVLREMVLFIDFIQTVPKAYFLLFGSLLLNEKTLFIEDRADIQSLLKALETVL